MKIIIIDYFNFLYSRYYDLEEKVIIKNLHDLSHFAKYHGVKINIFFDGTFWNYLTSPSNNITLFFPPPSMSADEYIIAKFKYLQGNDHYLITDDKKLIKTLQQTSSIESIKTTVFWNKLATYNAQHTALHIQKENNRQSKLLKTTDMVNDELDELYKTKL
jgi:hypothetical protein